MNGNILQENTVKLSRAEIDKAYYEANKEKRRELNKALRGTEAYRERQKAYHEANKEKHNTRVLANYYSNIVKRKAYRVTYYEDNKKEINAKVKSYVKKRKQTDELFNTKLKLRRCIYNAFRRIKQDKPTNTVNLLGCTWEEAKQHFEALFQPGMSWANHGTWHIDHIVPIARAKTVEEAARLNHISNLQPLWAKDNMTKGCY